MFVPPLAQSSSPDSVDCSLKLGLDVGLGLGLPLVLAAVYSVCSLIKSSGGVKQPHSLQPEDESSTLFDIFALPSQVDGDSGSVPRAESLPIEVVPGVIYV